MTDREPADRVRSTRVQVRPARWPEDLELVRRLLRGYRDWLADHADPAPGSGPRVQEGLALVDRLVADLPGAYGRPGGEILLWSEKDEVVACGALRELEPKVVEGKRVYVRQDYRGAVFGRPYVRALLGRARAMGYEKLRVDALASMTAAIEFYRELGFRPVTPFWPHPAWGALFFERDLREGADRRRGPTRSTG